MTVMNTLKEQLDRAEAYDGWDEPDASVLREGRASPPILPSAMFGASWCALGAVARDKGAPIDYCAMAYLVSAASVIGNKRWLRPYRTSNWREPAILWVGLVGDPSSNKTPALNPFLSALRKIEGLAIEDFEKIRLEYAAGCERAKVAKAAWQKDVELAHKEGLPTPDIPKDAVDPAAPHCRRLLVQDTTPEAIGVVLQGNPQGTMLFRDELSGWLASFDRYSQGGRSQWLEAYNGQPFTVDRKGQAEPIRVEFNGVSIVGAIQPQKLADGLFDGSDDGMPARFLWVWPDLPEFIRPASLANLQGFEDALRRLEGLKWGADSEGTQSSVIIPLEDDAADAFERFQRARRDVEANTAGLLKSFVGKMDGMALRLALVSEYMAWAYGGGEEPKSVSLATVEAVADFLFDYAFPMAQRVYGDAALPQVERDAAAIAKTIRRDRAHRINVRDDLQRKAPFKSWGADRINDALQLLEDCHWVRLDACRKGGSPGRHAREYDVNPRAIGVANA